METSIINVRIDTNDKKNFESFCSSVGMNVSTAINLFVKTVLRENKIPFEVKNYSSDEIYDKLIEAELEMCKTDKRYTPEEVFEDLNKIIRDKNV